MLNPNTRYVRRCLLFAGLYSNIPGTVDKYSYASTDKPADIVHTTHDVDLSDSWASERSLLFSLQTFSTYPIMWDLLNWTCESIFIFLLYYAFFSPLGHARYDIIVARGQLPQHRHRIASKARSTRYLLYVAYTPCVACTVRLVLMCSILYAQAPSSQTFFLLFVFFSLTVWDLHWWS